ncbi:hypothetical protein FHT40_006290 [Mycolicibacterium sp. BK556]|uniref:hypothetical protein n=1 Tax=Mycobacteriaceae TaxID=1762 RepID=UPI000D36BAEA|nr:MULTISPECIES: hypothetical protein [Mycobacteriaceae]MBB3606599.1 hypothetical protein [Mycolicibacterium sp. BK556]MBB3636154.1 hypothetical protein [Mycolicibacterium sp. BK607]MBB3753815.1 hypothetical protein [Mycolicibacterium sp. BK634]TDO06620.1 hypothetical protein EV580_6722 [Mycobacterium sp. BK086]
MQYVDETAVLLTDARVRIFFPSNQELRTSVMREPFASRGFADYAMDLFPARAGNTLTVHATLKTNIPVLNPSGSRSRPPPVRLNSASKEAA